MGPLEVVHLRPGGVHQGGSIAAYGIDVCAPRRNMRTLSASVAAKARPGEEDFHCELGGTWRISRESYHPNGVATGAYAQAFTRAMSKL